MPTSEENSTQQTRALALAVLLIPYVIQPPRGVASFGPLLYPFSLSHVCAVPYTIRFLATQKACLAPG
jgi:hypothetical protein